MLTNRTRRITVPLAIALAVVAGPTLAGCSVQGIINSATGGKVSLPGKSIPSDFPKDVPLAKGTVVFGAAIGDGKGGKVWNVTIQVDGGETFDSISSDITGHGFKSQGDLTSGSSSDGNGTATFDTVTYSVILVVAKADNKTTANYTVGTDNTSK
jgi:hypothetical protein